MSEHSPIYIGNTMLVRLNGVADHNGNAITDATVTIDSLKDQEGKDVAGVSLPITLSHASGGKYEGTLSKDADVTAGKVYEAVVSAVSGALTGKWTETLLAQVRSS